MRRCSLFNSKTGVILIAERLPTQGRLTYSLTYTVATADAATSAARTVGAKVRSPMDCSDRGRATIGVYPAESVAQHSAYIACVTVAITRKDGKRAVGENLLILSQLRVKQCNLKND